MSEDKLMHVVDLKLANISSNDRHHPTKRILDLFLLHTSQSFQEFRRHRSCSTHQDNIAEILPIFIASLDRLERAQTRWLQTSMQHSMALKGPSLRWLICRTKVSCRLTPNDMHTQ